MTTTATLARRRQPQHRCEFPSGCLRVALVHLADHDGGTHAACGAHDAWFRTTYRIWDAHTWKLPCEDLTAGTWATFPGGGGRCL